MNDVEIINELKSNPQLIDLLLAAKDVPTPILTSLIEITKYIAAEHERGC